MNRSTIPDAYTKFVLTVIAACLVWMCLADAVGPARSYAQEVATRSNEPLPVRIVEIARGSEGRHRARWDPFVVSGKGTSGSISVQVDRASTVPVRVENWPKSQSVRVDNWPPRVMSGTSPVKGNTPGRKPAK